MAELTENVKGDLILVCGNQVLRIGLLADLCLRCKCLRLGKKLWIYCGAKSTSQCLTLHQQCLPDLVQPKHRVWSTQRDLIQPLARQ